MASTPMDLDGPESSSANGTPSASLNITRTLGNNVASTSALTDIIGNFRPTKVVPRSSESIERAKLVAKLSARPSKKYITAASAASSPTKPALTPSPSISSSPPLKSEGSSAVLDSPVKSIRRYTHSRGSPTKFSGSPTTDVDGVKPKREHTKPHIDSISNSKQLFRREDLKEGKPQPFILSLDYDDPGELLMTSESDETIQIYKVREGRHEKQLLSKKYGVKLAKFTHTSSSIVYASTKVNDAIRYLTTHDNAFVRYFEGHEATVTCLAMHPGQDDFISCSKDNTIRLWNANTKNATGLLHLNTPYLAAYDPSGQVFAVASPVSGEILFYDHRQFDKAPFATYDIVDSCGTTDPQFVTKGWTKLEFSNDGKTVLLGTKGNGHFLLDAFDGTLKAYLRKPEGDSGTSRLAAGGEHTTNGSTSHSSGINYESSGDCCYTPDGRYVISGTRRGVLIWDTLAAAGENKVIEPIHRIEDQREAAVVAFNPRFNFFATADKDVVYWVPDPST